MSTTYVQTTNTSFANTGHQAPLGGMSSLDVLFNHEGTRSYSERWHVAVQCLAKLRAARPAEGLARLAEKLRPAALRMATDTLVHFKERHTKGLFLETVQDLVTIAQTLEPWLPPVTLPSASRYSPNVFDNKTHVLLLRLSAFLHGRNISGLTWQARPDLN